LTGKAASRGRAGVCSEQLALWLRGPPFHRDIRNLTVSSSRRTPSLTSGPTNSTVRHFQAVGSTLARVGGAHAAARDASRQPNAHRGGGGAMDGAVGP
jgi:hypothetical protein